MAYKYGGALVSGAYHYDSTPALGGVSLSGAAILAGITAGGSMSSVAGVQNSAVGWADLVRAQKRKRKPDPEEAMEAALEPIVSAPRKTITMATLIGKKAAAELAPFDSSAAVAISRKRKRQRDDEFLLLM